MQHGSQASSQKYEASEQKDLLVISFKMHKEVGLNLPAGQLID